MRHIAVLPNSQESRTLLKVSAAMARREDTFDENEIWSLGPEALGLLDALIERTISQP